MIDRIREKRDAIYEIARKHKAEKLWVFGSCARKEECPDSDIDFLVKFRCDASLLTHAMLKDELSSMFGRDVDIVSKRGVDAAAQYNFSAEVRKDMVEI